MKESIKTIQPAMMGQLGNAFLTWRRYLQKQVAKHEVTLKQFFVLRRLSKVAFLHPSQVAELLFCDRPTATVVINNLRKYGWVETMKDPLNRKFQQIMLTEQGKTKLNEINQSMTLNPDQLFDPLACFSTEEKQHFEALLEKLTNHLQIIA
ncbi:MAG: winged helix-turn-helix transcriptional regulator [Anaerolineaceae bacterium]|nr:winged helix-turn-helix transcriptional regulator [Anaerolineaceae bacterium]